MTVIYTPVDETECRQHDILDVEQSQKKTEASQVHVKPFGFRSTHLFVRQEVRLARVSNIC